jgi:tripartite-type tricarboxylate transporter receptor subunit TctC
MVWSGLLKRSQAEDDRALGNVQGIDMSSPAFAGLVRVRAAANVGLDFALVLALVWALVLAVLACAPAPAHAQSVEDFYKRKSIELYVGFSVGGGYDLYARTLARHISKYIPGNPLVVPKTMEGAGSLRLANWLYRVAPRDGTVLGTIGRGTAFDPVLGEPGAQFDGTKFTWIGSANDEISVCVAWHSAGIASFDDLRAKVLTVGGTGASADTDQFPRIINGVLGTKMRVIDGYPGGNDVVLAMERGEVQGRCGWSLSSLKATHQAWLDDHKIDILMQLTLASHSDLANVPMIEDLAKTEEQRTILKLIFARQTMGRPFLAPPGVPPDRAAALREAFMRTMQDKEFLADADKAQLEITPVAGDKVQALVQEVYDTPPEIAKRTTELLKTQ